MIKKALKLRVFLAIFSLLTVGMLFLAASPQLVKADIQPTFVINSTNSNSVQITVNGDPYSPVQLYYYQGGFTLFGTIGVTDQNGYLNITAPYSQFPMIPSDTSVYVVVNGMQSTTIVWPYYGSNYSPSSYNYTLPVYTQPIYQPTYIQPTQITFSQDNVSLLTGQSSVVSLYGGGNYYISSISNQYTISASISGNQLYIQGLSGGGATIVVCGNWGSCASLYVSVTSPAPTYYYPQQPIFTYHPPVYTYPIHPISPFRWPITFRW